MVLGGSWVVSRAISPVIWVISLVALLITLLITTHEPPSGFTSAQVTRQQLKVQLARNQRRRSELRTELAKARAERYDVGWSHIHAVSSRGNGSSGSKKKPLRAEYFIIY